MAPMHRTRRTFNDPGHALELIFSCYQRLPFLRADRTCGWLVEALHAARRRLDFEVWAYVFMPEHVHLIVHPCASSYQIPTILRAIKEPVGRRSAADLARHAPDRLERVTVRRGHRMEHHFWQPGGGFDRNIIEPATLRRMIDYIHLNPVRRGLVERARDWPWSRASLFEDAPRNACPLIPDRIPPEWCEE